MTTPPGGPVAPDGLADIAAALTENNASLLSTEGVRGTDIGLDEQEAPVIRIHVLDPDAPPDGLPDTVGGFPRVLRAWEQPTLLSGTVMDTNRYDPLRGGAMCSRIDRVDDPVLGHWRSGTLGCLFFDTDTGQIVGLSNAHVLAGVEPDGSFDVADPAFQPRQDGDPTPIGSLLRWEMPDTPPLFPGGAVLSAAPSGFWDAAVCSVQRRAAPADVGQILDIGTCTSLGSVRPGDAVRKHGARTGLTHGVVDGVLGSYPLFNSSTTGGWWMLGQIKIDATAPDPVFADSGDSGSVVVNDSNEIVALLHGGGGASGYASDILPLALRLHVSLQPVTP